MFFFLADGDWVALSSPALKVHALEESTPPSESSTESSVHAEAAAPEPAKPRIISYDHVKTTSTDPAQDVDPTKREVRSFFLSLVTVCDFCSLVTTF